MKRALLPGFNSPTELVSWLLNRGVRPLHMRLFQGPDGQWRGSGKVTCAGCQEGGHRSELPTSVSGSNPGPGALLTQLVETKSLVDAVAEVPAE